MKYLTVGIHYPKPEHMEDIVTAIKKVAEVALKCEGLVETGSWLDKENNRLVLMSLWESEEHARAWDEKLEPVLSAQGIKRPAPETWQVHNLLKN